MKKEFYKMALVPDEEGLTVVTTVLYPIHETPCFYFCVIAHWENYSYKEIKEFKGKVYRIAKTGSRIAFETKEEAFKNLVYLKTKQLDHCRRNVAFIERFLNDTEKKGMNALELTNTFSNNLLVLPETSELVSEYLSFY
jgi:hypothetical protein